MAEIDYRELNKMAKDPAMLIRLSEERYHAHISTLAKRISDEDGVKIILLAGPSGSGKTTTANLLSDAIKALGKDSTVVSLDDFYKDVEFLPGETFADKDFEALDSLDLDLLHQTKGYPQGVGNWFSSLPHSCGWLEPMSHSGFFSFFKKAPSD